MPTPLRNQYATLEKPMISAASLRGAIKGEIYPIDVTTSSKCFLVPDAWKGSLVRIQADGANVYYQISTDAAAAASVAIASKATEAGSPIALTPPSPSTGCIKIVQDTGEDIAFPLTAVTFALVGSGACVARCHLAET